VRIVQRTITVDYDLRVAAIMIPNSDWRSFWATAHLDLQDLLNSRIWKESIALQLTIQSPQALQTINAIGAQQAMIDPDPKGQPPITLGTLLPWVPDLLGSNWEDPEAVLVVGSAYAGFIREYNAAGAGMRLADYLASVSHHHSSFQTAFIQQVVRDFRTYYGFVERLGRALNGDEANARDIAVTELCKASFVMRVGNDGPEQWAANAGYTTTGRIVRRDDSAEPNGDRSASIFSDYAENTKAAGWLWDRLTSGSARRTLALGRVAEHGLLRCFGFRQEVTDIRCSKGPWTRHRNPDTNTWARVRNRAEPKLNIDHWLQAGEWWTVSAMIAGQPRDWHVLPIRHPARQTVDVTAVARLLRRM
jgi:hypothetical protein